MLKSTIPVMKRLFIPIAYIKNDIAPLLSRGPWSSHSRRVIAYSASLAHLPANSSNLSKWEAGYQARLWIYVNLPEEAAL